MPPIILTPPPKAKEGEEAIRGWSQIGLDQKGEKEAREIGRAMRGRGIGLLFSSDLPRAKRTAEIFSREMKVPLAGTSKELRTWDPGEELEGARAKDSEKLLKYYTEIAPDKAPKGGESINHAIDRVINKFNQIIEISLDSGVIIGIVTHHWVVDIILRAVEAGSPGKQLTKKINLKGFITDHEDAPGSVYDMRFGGKHIAMPLVPPGSNFHPGPVVIRHEHTSKN